MKRRLWIALLSGLLVALFAGLSQQAAAHLMHGPTLLSDPAAECSAVEPRLDTSADSQWLAITWIQSTQNSSGYCKDGQGRAVLRWATEGSAQTGWSAPLTVFDGSASGNCIVHADIAVHDTTAHIVATAWSPCYNTTDAYIYYRTCDLTTGACSSQETVASTTSGRMLDARIALDDQGAPHVIYNMGQDDASGGEVYYARKSGSSWTTVTELSQNNNYCQSNAYRPGIAWTQATEGSRLLFVWENRSSKDLCYRVCPAGGTCTTTPVNFRPWTPQSETTAPLPVVVAQNNRVVLVWQVCVDVNPNPPCQSFDLLYARSNDGGTGFITNNEREVGTDVLKGAVQRAYPGTNDEQMATYAAHLRPAATMDAAGQLHVTWQISTTGASSRITSTHVISVPTNQDFDWETRDEWQGQGGDLRLLPVIRMASPTVDPEGMHQVFMQQAAGTTVYRVYYDYFGTQRVAGVLLQPLTATAMLPDTRELPLVARVLNNGGAPVQGSAVTFNIKNPDSSSMDTASFNYAGVDDSPITLFTDADGWITATIYANRPVTVNVTAWLDYDGNVEVDETEPAAVVSRTWVMDPNYTGGYILVDNYAPKSSDPLQIGVRDHPYTAYGYSLWWCPITGTVKTRLFYTSTVQAPFNLDLEIRTPAGVSGGYYRIESHESDGGSDGCVDVDSHVAHSARIHPGGRLYLPLVMRKR